MKPIAFALVFALCCQSVCLAQTEPRQSAEVVQFSNASLLVPKKQSVGQMPVVLRFAGDALVIESRKTQDALKQLAYAEIKSAEYSYSRHPRWKEGVGASVVSVAALGVWIGAAAAVPPLAVLVGIPLFIKVAKTRNRVHWLTIKTESDFAVLRLDKDNYKLILPLLETRARVKVETIKTEK